MITITSTAGTFDSWSFPERVDVIETPDSIELIYKQTSMITYTSWPSPRPSERVFKIVFSCKDGKWHKSEPIYGEIIPASEEKYEF